jgi:hypothetical protein
MWKNGISNWNDVFLSTKKNKNWYTCGNWKKLMSLDLKLNLII